MNVLLRLLELKFYCYLNIYVKTICGRPTEEEKRQGNSLDLLIGTVKMQFG